MHHEIDDQFHAHTKKRTLPTLCSAHDATIDENRATHHHHHHYANISVSNCQPSDTTSRVENLNSTNMTPSVLPTKLRNPFVVFQNNFSNHKRSQTQNNE